MNVPTSSSSRLASSILNRCARLRKWESTPLKNWDWHVVGFKRCVTAGLIIKNFWKRTAIFKQGRQRHGIERCRWSTRDRRLIRAVDYHCCDFREYFGGRAAWTGWYRPWSKQLLTRPALAESESFCGRERVSLTPFEAACAACLKRIS